MYPLVVVVVFRNPSDSDSVVAVIKWVWSEKEICQDYIKYVQKKVHKQAFTRLFRKDAVSETK